MNSRSLPDGDEVPYELTGTWFSFMAVGHPDDAALDRHLAAHAIVLALRGVPLLYVHSLFASDNAVAGFAATGQGRDLNRATFDDAEIRRALGDPSSRANRSWSRLRTMLRWRATSTAFRPDAAQSVLDGPDEVLAVRRTSTDGDEALVVVNVADRDTTIDLPDGAWERFDDDRRVAGRLTLGRWSSVWLRRPGDRPG